TKGAGLCWGRVGKVMGSRGFNLMMDGKMVYKSLLIEQYRISNERYNKDAKVTSIKNLDLQLFKVQFTGLQQIEIFVMVLFCKPDPKDEAITYFEFIEVGFLNEYGEGSRYKKEEVICKGRYGVVRENLLFVSSTAIHRTIGKELGLQEKPE
nr:hypothetical protein [Tanacetum cinerariifolium]